jgi:cytochrome d ubiquinol oxidase subunit I
MYGEIRTADAATNLPPSTVLGSLITFSVVYSLLLLATLYFGRRIIRTGPNLTLPAPDFDTHPAVDPTPTEFIPDQRAVELRR